MTTVTSGSARSKLMSRAAVLAIAAASVVPVYAQSTDEKIEFNLPAQSLEAALKSYGVAADRQVMFATKIVDGKQAGRLSGDMTASEALDLLLQDSGLIYEVTPSGTILVKESQREGRFGGRRFQVAQLENDDRQGRPNTPRSADETDEDAPEEIVVTGSRIRGAQSASPITTITREDIDLGGFATVEEILETLPQNFGAGASTDATDSVSRGDILGGDVQAFAGGASVNLRGLGASSTLVLLNGRRLSPGGNSARFTNIASIPATAVERIEVLTDGASAIYGSDAIAGVINFILRDDYEGAETRIRYGSDLRGDTSNIQLGQSFGASWETGNALVTYEYYNSDALAARDRDFTASSDLRLFGGTDNRSDGGNPANIVAGGQTFAIPSGQDGASLTAADFNAAIAPNLHNRREFVDQIPDIERNSAYLFVTQEVEAIELFGQARYSREENTTRRNAGIADFRVSQSSPFFVDPTGTGLTEVTVDNYALEEDFGPQLSIGEIESYGATLGARAQLGSEWNAELVGNWSKEDAVRNSANVVDRAALLAAANNTDPDTAFNPFGDGRNTNAAVISALVNRNEIFVDKSENELWSIGANVDGTLFEAPGGAVKLASGIEYRGESLATKSFAAPDNPELSRDVLAIYGEVFVPLVSDANSRPGIERLEISLAGRYEEYSDFGNTSNPKLGLLWSPFDSLIVRGTYGKSFRAPSLPDLDGSIRGGTNFYVSDFFVNLEITPVPFLTLSGSNPELQPEEAVTWTTGLGWRPETIKGLSLDITFFSVDFDNRIDNPIVSIFAAVTDPRFESLVTLNPTTEQITAVVNDPRYDPMDFVFGTDVPAADLISGVLPVGAIVDSRRANSARLVTRGLEVQASYDFDTRFGAIGFSFNGNYLMDFERAIIPTDPLFDEVDTLGRPVDFRARSGATWSRGNWTAASYVNYIDGYTDQFNDPERDVDSWTTVDLTVAYRIDNVARSLSNTRLALTATNLFNEDPPFVETGGGVGYDATNANPIGRFVSFQITKEW